MTEAADLEKNAKLSGVALVLPDLWTFGLSRWLNGEICEQNVSDLRVRLDYALRGMVLNIRYAVKGEKIKEIVFPATLRDAIWERFAPKWLRRRFPVHYIRHTVAALYPTVPVPGLSWNRKVFTDFEPDSNVRGRRLGLVVYEGEEEV
jgi:hypothetical protein